MFANICICGDFLPRTRMRLTLPMFANIYICGDSCIARGCVLRLNRQKRSSIVQTFLHRVRVSSCVTVNSLVIHLMSDFLHRARMRLA